MKTLTTGVAALVLVGAAYAAVTVTGKDPRDRKASIECWWTPSTRQATVGWKFGTHHPGAGLVTGPTRSGPWHRGSTVKAGETVHLDLRFLDGQPTIAPGLYRSCKIKAGTNVETYTAKNHEGLNTAVIVS